MCSTIDLPTQVSYKGAYYPDFTVYAHQEDIFASRLPSVIIPTLTEQHVCVVHNLGH